MEIQNGMTMQGRQRKQQRTNVVVRREGVLGGETAKRIIDVVLWMAMMEHIQYILGQLETIIVVKYLGGYRVQIMTNAPEMTKASLNVLNIQKKLGAKLKVTTAV